MGAVTKSFPESLFPGLTLHLIYFLIYIVYFAHLGLIKHQIRFEKVEVYLHYLHG